MIYPSCKACPVYSIYCEYDPLTDTIYPNCPETAPQHERNKVMQMTKETYRPLEGKELLQLQFMYSLFRCLKDDDSLKNRLTSMGMWWRYRGMIRQLHNMFDATWKTIDPENRKRIDRIWSQQELRIVNAGAPTDPTGDTLMIPKRAVLLWGQHCQQETCTICMGGHGDRKDCKFRQGMVAMSLPDLRRLEKQSGKCMGKLFDWNC